MSDRRYDAVVVGGGHNGLVCATYLARAGMAVLLLEARDELGGMARLADSLDGFAPAIADELGLATHGLQLVESEAAVFAPRPDGGAVTLWSDAARTAAGLDGADAERYGEADARLRALAAELAPMLEREPLTITELLARMPDSDALRTLSMPVADLLGEWLDSDALRAAIAWRALLFTGLAPRAPGTAGLLLAAAALSGSGLASRFVSARGGPTALIDALAAALRAAGGEIRTATRVTRVTRDGQRVTGVTLESGEQIGAPVVVSGLDPQTTLLTLLEPEAIGPRLAWRAANIRQRGVTARVEFHLSGRPEFPAAEGDTARLGGWIVIAPSMTYVEHAMRAARYHEAAAEPLVVATLADDRLVALAQPAVGAEVADAVSAAIERVAPGFAALVAERSVTAPADLEREFGVVGGHPLHAEPALDQSFAWRPLHGAGRYRLPIDGYFIGSGGAHPGGGVTGLPGRLAAQAVLSERAALPERG